jgi:hypothetical protein
MSGASSEDSSIFARCEDVDCNKKIPVELVRMHICYAMFHRTLGNLIIISFVFSPLFPVFVFS